MYNVVQYNMHVTILSTENTHIQYLQSLVPRVPKDELFRNTAPYPYTVSVEIGKSELSGPPSGAISSTAGDDGGALTDLAKLSTITGNNKADIDNAESIIYG